ncbi:MAG: hypothetical protein IPM82_04330 [Saprospiraceae bacterium]|nr:hypothetical protein [Saprospiraceae bacterium]
MPTTLPQSESHEQAIPGNDGTNAEPATTQTLAIPTHEKTATASEAKQTKSVGNTSGKQAYSPAMQNATSAGNVVAGNTAENKANEKLPTDLTPAQADAPSSTANAVVMPIFQQDKTAQIPAFLPRLPFALLDRTENTNPSVKAEYLPETEVPLRRSQPFSWSIGLQGSLSFVDRKLEARDSFSSALLALRENSERELEAYQIGMRFTARHRSGFGLTSGLNFTQINEQFRFNSTVISVDSVYGVKYLAVNFDNDTIPIYGEIPLETKTSYRKEYYNRYRMIDIPVLAGYHYQGRNGFLSAQVGIFVNLSLATQGQIMQSATEFMAIDTAGIFRPNIGLSYYFGLSAGYSITEHLEAYISPFMRHYPKSFTEDSYALRQRYNLYGVDIGVRYHF